MYALTVVSTIEMRMILYFTSVQSYYLIRQILVPERCILDNY